jgi:hypothetical protein
MDEVAVIDQLEAELPQIDREHATFLAAVAARTGASPQEVAERERLLDRLWDLHVELSGVTHDLADAAAAALCGGRRERFESLAAEATLATEALHVEVRRAYALLCGASDRSDS